MNLLPAAVAGGLSVAALLLAGPRATALTLRDLWTVIRQERIALVAGLVLALLLPVLSRQNVDVPEYVLNLAASTFAALAAVVLAARFGGITAGVSSLLLGARPALVALALLTISAVAATFVLGNIPHVSDEVAYQFQARTLALGHLTQPPPLIAESFVFTHTLVDGDHWYGIMNPGWPLILAAGELIQTPWLVNPVVGALSVIVFHRAFRAGGIGEMESRIGALLIALTPFIWFMNGSLMAHPVNLLLFGLFCWAWARMLETGNLLPALGAGLAMGLNLMVRPIDAVAVALPFGILALFRIRRQPRLIFPLLFAGLVASSGVVGTLLYNQALTGDPFSMPMTKYFFLRNPAEQFGLGFGPEMGTSIHGPEFPGYYPSDAVRVTAYRLAQFAIDLYGLPLLVLALPWTAFRRRWSSWQVTFFGTILSLVVVYIFHFYHGIAYGSRHYYLAIPAFALLLANPMARALESQEPTDRRRVQVLLTALVFHVLVFALPPLVREYSATYRGSSPAVRDAVRRQGLTNALVFVADGNWAWKSAFPLNQYPLGKGAVVFARDRGADNQQVQREFPGRTIYYLSVKPGNQVSLQRASSSSRTEP